MAEFWAPTECDRDLVRELRNIVGPLSFGQSSHGVYTIAETNNSALVVSRVTLGISGNPPIIWCSEKTARYGYRLPYHALVALFDEYDRVLWEKFPGDADRVKMRMIAEALEKKQ